MARHNHHYRLWLVLGSVALLVMGVFPPSTHATQEGTVPAPGAGAIAPAAAVVEPVAGGAVGVSGAAAAGGRKLANCTGAQWEGIVGSQLQAASQRVATNASCQADCATLFDDCLRSCSQNTLLSPEECAQACAADRNACLASCRD